MARLLFDFMMPNSAFGSFIVLFGVAISALLYHYLKKAGHIQTIKEYLDGND
jgi:hypothetical protein